MSAKLSASNPYLSDPAIRQRGVLESVTTSSAIEGIRAPFKKTSPAVKRAAKKAGSASPVKAKSV
jgi:Fic family protein